MTIEPQPTQTTDHTLMGTDDAMVWAQEFCRIFDGFTILPDDLTYPANDKRVDEGTMVAWFANAMQVAVNMYERRKLHEKGELTETEKFLKDWDEEHPEPEEEPTLEESFKEGFDEGRPPK